MSNQKSKKNITLQINYPLYKWTALVYSMKEKGENLEEEIAKQIENLYIRKITPQVRSFIEGMNGGQEKKIFESEGENALPEEKKGAAESSTEAEFEVFEP